MEKKIILVTGNEDKLKETKKVLKDFEVIHQHIELPEPQGTGEEIIKHKARAAFRLLGEPLIVEDTSLEFTALGGLPGPYVKYFYNQIGNEGLVRLLDGFLDKTAQLVNYLGYIDQNGETHVFKGVVSGNIVNPRGNTGFGFDYIFELPSIGKTFAEIDPNDKHKISHRALALFSLLDFLESRKLD